MNDSLTEALSFRPTAANKTNDDKGKFADLVFELVFLDLLTLQRAIHLALRRRLLERQKQSVLRRAELEELEEQRTRLLKRIECGVFIAFCIFYIAVHLGFICWVYFGVSEAFSMHYCL
ncbi:unnamed protein product [Dibothriocephalus latus]|uniref:Uncharacterized protein n=1 Tax=Dibothriocephalus latus TaxID=60516 RepID=A0A3P7M2N2_DIBLA|nr:unnamed protein product [Dibothriocephalus latus]